MPRHSLAPSASRPLPRPAARIAASVLAGGLLCTSACDAPDEFDEIELEDEDEAEDEFEPDAPEALSASSAPNAAALHPIVTTRPAGCPTLGADRRWPISAGTDPLGWPIPDDPTPQEILDTIDVIGDVYSWIIRDGDPYMHHGVDFRTAPESGDVDAPVHAVASGFVTRVCSLSDPDYSTNGCSDHPGKGNWVMVQHDDALTNPTAPRFSVYAHLESIEPGLTTGSCIDAADPIGIAGDTGSASSEHLHLEVHEGLTSSRSPDRDTSISPWTLLPERATPSVDEVEMLSPAPNGDLRAEVRVEAMHSTIARVVQARMSFRCFPLFAPPYWACFPDKIAQTRELEVRGSTMEACTPSVGGDPDSTPLCNGFLVEATDYNPGQYQTDNNAHRVHEWRFTAPPLSVATGDETFMIYDVDDQLIGMTAFE